MGKLLSFQGKYNNSSGFVKANLILIHFIDENDNHIIYSPHLDLSGYGKTKEEAKQSFEINFNEFIDYTLKKKTLGNLLQKLGWQVKGSSKKPKKVITPSMKTILDKSYVSEIFDKYQTETFHEEVPIPQ